MTEPWQRFLDKKFTVRRIVSPVDFLKAWNVVAAAPAGPIVVHNDAVTRLWLDAYANIAWIPDDNPGTSVSHAAIGFTGASLALTQTGTLLLAEDSGFARLVSNMVPTHIALVPENRVVSDWHEALSRLKREENRVPRILSWISGPSQTADIQGALVYGMHGPLRVEVWIVPAVDSSSLVLS